MSWARRDAIRKLLPLLTALCAASAPPAGDAAPVAPTDWQTQADQALQVTQQSMRAIVLRVARGVDSWFGDRPFESGGSVTDAAVSTSLIKRPEQGTEFNVRFNARLRLPNLEARTYLFLANDDLHELVTDKPDALSRQESLMPEGNPNPSFFAGLGLPVLNNIDVRLGVHGLLKPYAQLRYRQPWQLDAADLLTLRETLFWTTEDRLGSTSVVSIEHAVTPSLALRWLNSATYTQHSMQLEWSSGLGAYQSMGPQRLLSVEALASTVTGSGPNSSDVGAQVKWAQALNAHGLLGEVLVGHFWPRTAGSSGRTRAWAVGVTLQLTF